MTNRLLISLSGGGFRSALFNAGVLRVLHEKGLLDVSTDIRPRNVIVSAVSGGSIPAALWDRFLKSEQFQLSPKALLPESELLRLVTTCPKLLGKLNWHLRGWGIFAQRSWRQFLSKWWETISLTPYDPKFFSASGPFIVPGDSQYFPTFVLETLDFNSGDVVMYCNGEYFKPNVEFFKNGNVGIVREKY